MTTQVINVEDKTPYVEVLTDAEVCADSLKESAATYRDTARYHREKKQFGYAKLEQDIANELERIAKAKDPEAEATWTLRNMAYAQTEIRAAIDLARQLVMDNNEEKKDK